MVMLRNSVQILEQRSLASIVSRTLLVPMVLLLTLLGAVIYQAEVLIRTEIDLLHADQVLNESRVIFRSVAEMESNLRGYLLTGSDQFLQPYRAAQREIVRRMDGLDGLAQSSPQQEVQVHKLRDASLAWQQYAEQMITLRRNGEDVSDTDLNLAGKSKVEEIRRIRDDLITETESFSAERVPQVRRAASRLIAVIVTAAGVLFIFVVFVRRPQIMKLVEGIQKSRAQLTLATEVSNLGTWYWNVAENSLELGERCRVLFGLAREEEASLELLLQHIHPDDRTQCKEAIESGLKTGSPVHLDLRVTWPDSSVHWINLRGRAFLEHGRPVAMYGVAIDVTHRMEVEQALRESRMRFEGIVQGAMDAIISIDEHQRIVVFNKAAENIFGVPADEAIGATLDRFIPSRYVEQHRQHIRSFDRSGITSRSMQSPGLLTGVRANGEEFPIEATISKVQLQTHSLFTVILRDITERHQAEEKLRASEEKFRAAFQFAAVGFGRVSFSDACWMDANVTLCNMLGYTHEELRVTPWPDITHYEDVEIDWAPFKQMSMGEISHYSVEKRFVHKSGRLVWARLTLSLARDAAGNPDYEIAIVEDITDRKRAQEALRQSETRFRALANALPQLVWTSDANGVIDYVNDRWIKYTGFSAEQVARTSGMELLLPEEGVMVAVAWKNALESKTEFNREYRIRSADGEYRWFLVRAVPIFDSGNLVRWFGSCTDIEEMKRSQELLIRSEKLASTGRMAATVAHEINNPLAVVTNTLYLALTDSTLTPQTRANLELAQRELNRVAHLTQQTLGFYRERPELAVVRMSAVAEEVAEIFEAKRRQKQVELVREFADNDTIHIVESELKQIISNLLANALDVAPVRSRIVMRTARVRPFNGKPPMVQFTLADCGPGIPREMKEKIFEPFFTTKLAYGTGLGLWVTRSLTLKHSGTIRVRSPRGMGAVFSVRFPAASEPIQEPFQEDPKRVVNQ